MRIRAVIVVCALVVACTPDPPDRRKTCEHLAQLLDKCFPSASETVADTVSRCTVAYKGSPDKPVDKDTARLWARIRSLANCADKLPVAEDGCAKYRNCVQQTDNLFPEPTQ